MATGWLGCLRAVTAAALLVEAASKQVLPGTITEVLTPHQIQGVLEAKGHRWWLLKYQVKSLSRVQLFATLWTVARQALSLMGSLKVRILEWVAISFSRGSSQPRDWTQISRIAGRLFTIWATSESPTPVSHREGKGFFLSLGNPTQGLNTKSSCKSKLQWGYHLTWIRITIIEKSTVINAGEGVERRELFCTVGGNVSWCRHYENSMMVPLKPKHSVAIWSSSSTPRMLYFENIHASQCS